MILKDIYMKRVSGLKKEEFRALFPSVTEFADKCRAVFGDGVKLIYAEENGRCIGKRSVSDPENTVNVSEIEFDTKPDDMRRALDRVMKSKVRSNGKR